MAAPLAITGNAPCGAQKAENEYPRPTCPIPFESPFAPKAHRTDKKRYQSKASERSAREASRNLINGHVLNRHRTKYPIPRMQLLFPGQIHHGLREYETGKRKENSETHGYRDGASNGLVMPCPGFLLIRISQGVDCLAGVDHEGGAPRCKAGGML